MATRTCDTCGSDATCVFEPFHGRSRAYCAKHEVDGSGLFSGMGYGLSRDPHADRPAPPPAVSLRDRFAMAALTGFVADASNRNTVKQNAESSYLVADAMLIARKGG